MFGKNVRRGTELYTGKLQVREVFFTLQGEGPFSGMPAAFIRLTGCNLGCWFCDTVWDDKGDSYVAPYDIAFKARMESVDGCKLAVITGGEPLRQDLTELVRWLKHFGFSQIQIETAGTYWQDICKEEGVTTVISPKSKVVHNNFYQDGLDTHWKYVIKAGDYDVRDGLPTQPMQYYEGRDAAKLRGGRPARPPRGRPVYLQPCDEQDEEKNKLNREQVKDLAMRHNYRACIQLHKYLGVE